MKQTIFLLFLLLINSCLAVTDPLFSSIPTSNNFVNRFPQNKKGIVLLQLNSDYLAISWCQADFEYEVKDKNCVKLNPSNYYQVIMLEPGWYEIEGYKIVNRRFQSVRIKEIAPSISNITGKRKSPPELAFEVVAGKISYAGQIMFHLSSVGKTQIKGDDFELVKSAFKDKRQLSKIFKSHREEAKIIAGLVNDNAEILVKNLAKTRSDFTEEKQIIKKEAREERLFLKKHAKKMHLQKNNFNKLAPIKKLRSYEN